MLQRQASLDGKEWVTDRSVTRAARVSAVISAAGRGQTTETIGVVTWNRSCRTEEMVMKNAIGFSRLRCMTAVIAVAFVACSVVAYAGDTSDTAPPAIPLPVQQVPHDGFNVAAVQQAVIREMEAEIHRVDPDALKMFIGTANYRHRQMASLCGSIS